MTLSARTISFLALVICLSAIPAYAQQAPCSDPGYRQFDFWVGKWEVFRRDGKVAGANRIEREYGGCVLHERYATPGKYTGESLNTYDPSRKMWHQT